MVIINPNEKYFLNTDPVWAAKLKLSLCMTSFVRVQLHRETVLLLLDSQQCCASQSQNVNFTETIAGRIREYDEKLLLVKMNYRCTLSQFHLDKQRSNHSLRLTVSLIVNRACRRTDRYKLGSQCLRFPLTAN